MSEAVKPGGKRGEQARRTRRRIIDAGAVLFIENGYAATTLDQVAQRAGVAVQTVYFHFGNKRTVLKEAVDVAAVGDDEPIPLLDRPWVVQIRAESEPRRIVELWVHYGRDIFKRVAPIMRVVRDAAAMDPDMAEQWETNQLQRATAFGVLAQLLADKDALKPGMSVTEATDIIFTLLSIEVYLLLTVTRGWTPARWEPWVVSALTDSLLRGH
ncbi:MAG: hypothetical protein QOI21_3253 [Actinomycetota bacterium]|jgi:AcrR family transcriptional regulator|nr:hypothetical protein [Actinomycetota bacterium]